MVIAPRFPRGPLLAAIILLFMSGVTDSSRAGTTPAALYETFGSGGVAGINLTNPPVGIGNLNINATNIVAGGGMVYFQSGATIYSTSTNIVGLNTVFTNPVAPTGLALDAADGILYETFGAGGVAAINLANPSVGIGSLNVNATNIVAGGGMVYFQSGATIYSSSAKLVGLNTVFTNRVAPTGLALRPMVSVPEPSSVGLALLGLTGSLAGHLFRRDRAATGRN